VAVMELGVAKERVAEVADLAKAEGKAGWEVGAGPADMVPPHQYLQCTRSRERGVEAMCRHHVKRRLVPGVTTPEFLEHAIISQQSSRKQGTHWGPVKSAWQYRPRCWHLTSNGGDVGVPGQPPCRQRTAQPPAA
jgi:hypothetical protein